MSRIAFTGNASGTGTVTMAAPNTNSDRTVTLPDQTGTLYISGGDIGTPSGGNGSNLTNLNASNLSSGTVPDARFPATLPAASGVNLTALNASNLGSGTVPTARLATGTASSSTYLRGDQTWATVSGYTGPQGRQVFASSGTFTVPSGITSVNVTVVGAGGGVNRYAGTSCSAAGGAAVLTVTGLTPGGTVSVTIGTVGGNAGGNVNNRASTGGTSSFGAFCSATGGQGANSARLVGSTGGAGSGGNLNINGQNAYNLTGGAGAAPLGLGMPGLAQDEGCAGFVNVAGVGYGFGGVSIGFAGTNIVSTGGNGVVIVEW